jgi:hypothetical protein
VTTRVTSRREIVHDAALDCFRCPISNDSAYDSRAPMAEAIAVDLGAKGVTKPIFHNIFLASFARRFLG